MTGSEKESSARGVVYLGFSKAFHIGHVSHIIAIDKSMKDELD